MKNSIKLDLLNNEYLCQEFYDSDKNDGGIEVIDTATNEVIGEVFGVCIPDNLDEDYKSDLEILRKTLENELKDKLC